jgi:putative flippase GtrA
MKQAGPDMRQLVQKLASHSLVRYFFVASFIVAIELVIFQILYWMGTNYVIGTTVSFAVAVVLNWALSRKVVFGASQHSMAKEFVAVSLVSIIGLGIQLLVVYACINKAHLYPLLGKIISILTSFFWNYWCRAHFIFGTSAKPSIEETIERIDTSIY